MSHRKEVIPAMNHRLRWEWIMGFVRCRLCSEGRSTGTEETIVTFCIQLFYNAWEEHKEEGITEVGSRWLVHMRGRLFRTPCDKYNSFLEHSTPAIKPSDYTWSYKILSIYHLKAHHTTVHIPQSSATGYVNSTITERKANSYIRYLVNQGQTKNNERVSM